MKVFPTKKTDAELRAMSSITLLATLIEAAKVAERLKMLHTSDKEAVHEVEIIGANDFPDRCTKIMQERLRR